VSEPTEQDRQNAELRAGIASRERAKYGLAHALAVSVLGPGWTPTGRHYLATHDEAERARREGRPMRPVAEVITAERNGEKRHVRVIDGKADEVPGWREGFGALMDEPDPNVRGEGADRPRAKVFAVLVGTGTVQTARSCRTGC
jgi:hypothetical protein